MFWLMNKSVCKNKLQFYFLLDFLLKIYKKDSTFFQNSKKMIICVMLKKKGV